ncbi:MAG: metal-sensitive transcriptional regulator [Acidobacteria bacterium]|nr:metal-sensitive transcriptional regulator [Acidobacteriota bacterium]
MTTKKTTPKNMAPKAKSRIPASCAVAPAHTGRKAISVAPEIKASNLRRLIRIEGQLRGIQRMVEDDRYCADILTQVSSVQEALRAVARALMGNHLTHCATQAIRSGTADQRQAMYDELLQMIYKNAR